VNLEDHDFTDASCEGDLVLYSEKGFSGESITFPITRADLAASSRIRTGDANVNDGNPTRFLAYNLNSKEFCRCQSTVLIYNQANYQGKMCFISADAGTGGLDLDRHSPVNAGGTCDNLFKSYKINGNMDCCQWKVCKGYGRSGKGGLGDCSWLEKSGDNNVKGSNKFKISHIRAYHTTGSTSNLNLNKWANNRVRSMQVPPGCGMHLSRENRAWSSNTAYTIHSGQSGFDLANIGSGSLSLFHNVQYLSVFQERTTWKAKTHLTIGEIAYSCRIVFYKQKDCTGSSHARYYDSDKTMNSYKPLSMKLLENDRSWIDLGLICREAVPLTIPFPIKGSLSGSVKIGFDDLSMTTPCKFELHLMFWYFLPSNNPVTDIFAVGARGNLHVSLYRDYSGVYEVGGCIRSFVGMGFHQVKQLQILPEKLRNMLWVTVYLHEVCLGALKMRVHDQKMWGGFVYIRYWPWTQVVGIYYYFGFYIFPEKVAPWGETEKSHVAWEVGAGQKLWLVVGSIHLWKKGFGPFWEHV